MTVVTFSPSIKSQTFHLLSKKMASGRPKVAESPLELLNTPQLEPGVLNRFFFPACGGSIGFFAGIVGNWASQRPVWSGVQKHILLTVAGVALGFYLEDRKSKRVAERDAVYRHYVQLHPEDFPPYERKQYKDVLENWYPVR